MEKTSLSSNLDGMLDWTMMACQFQPCNYHGDCVIENRVAVCKCWLGYNGETCGGTVNDGLSAPLTLGVLGFVMCFIILAFALACVHQKRWKKKRKLMDEKELLEKNGDFYPSSVCTDKEKPPSE